IAITFAPDSVADGTILGVWISVKPRASSVARNPATLAAAISKPARSTGWRRVVGAWSSTVGSAAVTAGRYRSNGGGRLAPEAGGRGPQHDLSEPGPVPDDQERHRLELALAMQPAGDADALADVRAQVAGEDSDGCHGHSRLLLALVPLGSAGEKGTRGATAPLPRPV